MLTFYNSYYCQLMNVTHIDDAWTDTTTCRPNEVNMGYACRKL